MAIALVNSVSVAGDSGGGTTAAIDTTGANLLVIGVAYYGSGGSVTISDSKSNTWTPRTQYANSITAVRIYYAQNPSVGTGHTFTISGSGIYGALAAGAFSGALTSGVYDVENGAQSAAASTLQPGSVTPSVDNELLICILGSEGSITETINSSFTKQQDVNYSAGSNFGLGYAYKIQTTAGAENPTWTLGSTENCAAAIATFKAAAAGGGAIAPISMYYHLHGIR